MIFKDGKTFSAYVRSKLHSGYITSLECKGKFRGLKNLPIKAILKINKQFWTQTNTMYNIPGVLLTKLTNAVHFLPTLTQIKHIV